VDGSCAIDDVREELGVDIPDGEYVTVGGFLLDAFGHIPEEQESLDATAGHSPSRRWIGRRIAKVVLEAPSATIPSSGTDDGRDGK
jgi:putative hemolysin